jgi:hypothetical protein
MPAARPHRRAGLDLLTAGKTNRKRYGSIAVRAAGGPVAMPIRPFLEGEFFEPELITMMSEALADACKALGLKDKEDAAVRLLAMRIIEEARNGVHERALLTAAALRGLSSFQH